MDIECLTIKEAREIAAMFGAIAPVPTANSRGLFWNVGDMYFIETHTKHYTGKLVAISDSELVLIDAAWIPDDGRFADAMKTGEYKEVEPYPDGERVLVNRSAVLSAIKRVNVPRSQR